MKPVFSKQFNELHISGIDYVTKKLNETQSPCSQWHNDPSLPSSIKENPIVNLAAPKLSNNEIQNT